MSELGERSPRVERLRYVARSPGGVHFRKTHMNDSAPMLFADDGPPDPVVGVTDEFRVTLQDGRVTVEMLADYATVDGAREVVEPYLRAWEIQAFLQHVAMHTDLQQPLHFQFDGADVVDPVPGPPMVIQVQAAQGFFYGAYPSPPDRFLASPEVRTMWLRWQEYQAGRESLTSMAYYCLTVLETSSGGRKEVGARYHISRSVLDTFGRLVSRVGDQKIARKADVQERRPHTAEEQRWIEEVVLALMQRTGEHAFDPAKPFTELTMTDLRPIEGDADRAGKVEADNRG